MRRCADRWPVPRTRGCRGRRPAAAVSTAVPVNRSRTTLCPSARADDLGDVRADARSARPGRAAPRTAAPPGDTAPRSSRCPVTASLTRSSRSRIRRGVDVQDGVPDVVAQHRRCRRRGCRAVQARAGAPGSRWHSPGTARPRASSTARQKATRVPDGGVAADPLGELDAAAGVRPCEQLLDAPVGEPEPRLQVEYRLADHGETEVSRPDHPRVHRPDRDLIHPGPFDRAERIGSVDRRRSRGGSPASAQHRVPALGPVEVPHQPGRAADDPRARCRTGHASRVRTGRRGTTARPG